MTHSLDPARSNSDRPTRRPLTAAADGALAVARLVAASQEHGDPAQVGETLLTEARRLLGASHAALLAFADQGATARAVRGDVVGDVAVADHPELAAVLGPRRPARVLEPAEAADLGRRLLAADAIGAALLVAIPTAGPTHVVVLAHPEPGAFDDGAVAAFQTLVAAASDALARFRLAEQEARRLGASQALTRAAKTLNESLDLPTVLRRISHEANRILDGDYTAVYRGTRDAVIVEAATGMPPEMIGFRLEPHQGLSGKVLTTERSMLTNDYSGLDFPPGHPFFEEVRSCLAVPMGWGGQLRGVLTVGYKRPFEVTEEHLGLLEAFAEIAAVACSNASTHAGLALVARTDGLTGCLNHAALHESLRKEIDRAERGPDPALSLVMIDLDDFKSVNEEHGHLVGDEVLRRAGHALRQATRPYDVAARYGGDEFALLAVDTGEEEAQEIARRAIERITTVIGDLCDGDEPRATAGVAQWRPGQSAVELIAEADRALLYGKHEGGRGRALTGSVLPDWFRPGRFARRPDRDAPPPAAPRPPVSAAALAPAWPEGPRPAEQRLRDRTRALARTVALGAELTALLDDPARMLETAAAGLTEALQASGATVLRLAADGTLERVAGDRGEDPASVAHRCVEERRPILVTDAAVRGRLAVPLRLTPTQDWGVIEVTAAKPGDLDEDDLHLASSFAAQLAAAIGAGERHAAALRGAQGSRAPSA